METEEVSIVIPAYNEEGAISETITTIDAVMSDTDYKYEVIVVDDGSTDNTTAIVEKEKARVITLPQNLGYGAALKTGIRRSNFETIVIIDADGTYPTDMIPTLIQELGEHDMVVGSRTGEQVDVALIRAPAKWFLKKLAGYLAGQHIPDLNSGMRVIRKPLVRRFVHLLPQGFSFTTTITLASLCSGSLVKYVPINYYKRVGQSKIKATHAFDFLLLIIRTIVYFNPLKVFLPLGAVFFVGGLIKFIYDLYIGNFSETALLGFVTATVLWALGLLSDQISKIALRSDTF